MKKNGARSFFCFSKRPKNDRTRFTNLYASVLVLTLASLSFVLVVYDRGTEVRWLGSFPLEVHLMSKRDRRLTKVSFDTLASRNWAEEVRNGPPWPEFDPRPVQSFADGRFTVSVRTIGTDSGLGRQLTYAQEELLLLWLDFADGERRFEVVEIPNGPGGRQVMVESP
jgi:hypothetical protein